jgi:isocitrate lyase
MPVLLTTTHRSCRAEAGFGGVLNAYELMKAMIRAGAGGVH